MKLMGIGAVAGLIASCTGKSSLQLQQGDRFPDVELFSLEGGAVSLSTFAGASLILNFWASWCEPCRREMPSLQKLSKLYRPDDLLVVGITVDSDVNLAREFILQNELTFPMLSDRNMRISNEILGVPGYPMTFLLARDRTIARTVSGERNWVEPKSLEDIEYLLRVTRIRQA